MKKNIGVNKKEGMKIHLIWFFLIALGTAIVSILIYDQLHHHETVILRDSVPNASWVKQQEKQWPSAPATHQETALVPKEGFVHAAALAAPAVVFIRTNTSNSFNQSPYTSTSGSGVIVSDDGYVVTNYHVIEEGKSVEIVLNDRRVFDASIVGVDRTTDLALLKIQSTSPLPFLRFGDSDELDVGEWVVAVGNPFRLQSTVTAGIVSAKARDIDILDTQYGIESFIQTDAAVNQGNSGGALVDIEGNLVGVNTAIITFSGRYEGYSFAIPINLVKKVISDLKEFGTVHRGILGLEARSVDDQLAAQAGLDTVQGVYIFRVNPQSGADDAGIVPGDIIVGINGHTISTLPELTEMVGRYRPGDSVDLSLWKQGEKQKLSIILKNQFNTTDLVTIRKDELFTSLGFELRDLIRSERESLQSNGIKVVSIYRGSTIERTKMDPGFIITHINEVPVSSTTQFLMQLQKIDGRVVLQGLYEQYEGPFWYVFEK